MVNPQKENGCTQIANELIEAFCRLNLSGHESRLLWCILRKTYGWNKKIDNISLIQFSTITGISTSNICRALKRLEAKKVITIEHSNGGYMSSYSLNKDYSTWSGLTVTEQTVTKQTVTKQNTNSDQIEYGTVTKQTVTKDTITKDTIQNTNIYKEKVKKENVNNLYVPYPNDIPLNIKYSNVTNLTSYETGQKRDKNVTPEIELPEFIDKELWQSFIDMRKKIKKPATDKAQELLIKKLTGYYQDGENVNQILENSIINSWQGLFSIKNKNYPPGNTSNSKPRFNDNKRDILTYGQEKPQPGIEDVGNSEAYKKYLEKQNKKSEDNK
jgi:phage replication O-like protein O